MAAMMGAHEGPQHDSDSMIPPQGGAPHSFVPFMHAPSSADVAPLSAAGSRGARSGSAPGSRAAPGSALYSTPGSRAASGSFPGSQPGSQSGSRAASGSHLGSHPGSQPGSRAEMGPPSPFSGQALYGSSSSGSQATEELALPSMAGLRDWELDLDALEVRSYVCALSFGCHQQSYTAVWSVSRVRRDRLRYGR